MLLPIPHDEDAPVPIFLTYTGDISKFKILACSYMYLSCCAGPNSATTADNADDGEVPLTKGKTTRNYYLISASLLNEIMSIIEPIISMSSYRNHCSTVKV